MSYFISVTSFHRNQDLTNLLFYIIHSTLYLFDIGSLLKLEFYIINLENSRLKPVFR